MNDCIEVLQAEMVRNNGRRLTDEELDAIFTQLQGRQMAYQLAGLGPEAAASRAAEEIGTRALQASIIEKRNATINATVRVQRVQWIRNNFPTKIAEGLESILVSTNRAKEGGRRSVMTEQHALRQSYLGGFIADLERSGNRQMLTSGAMDLDVTRALWAFGRSNEADALARLPAEAVAVARVIDKWQEVARLDANEAGAWIGKTTGYIVRQTHDADRIRGGGAEADYLAWRDMALATFDLRRMHATHAVNSTEGMLRDLWTELASGNFLKPVADDAMAGFSGPANMAKKLSQSREVYFKDADGWFQYNQQFGARNLREAVIAGLGRNANATGAMRMLGTNPESMFDTIRRDLVDALKGMKDVQQVRQVEEHRERLDNYMAAVSGKMDISVRPTLARISANIRAWETLSKLGGAVLSQFGDLATYASEVRYQGRSALAGFAEALTGLGRGMSDPARRELAASLGVVLDNMAGELGRMGSFAEPGSLSGVVQKFMRLNLMAFWTDRMRASGAFGMSHHMALQLGKGWDALEPDYRRVLGLYGIGADQWKIISAVQARTVDGRAHITPEMVSDIVVRRALTTYFVDRTGFLALEADAKTKAIALRGTQPGTWDGEFLRFLTQFKSFAVAFTHKTIGRELYGRGYEGDSLLGALRNGNGEFMGMAQLIATTTAMGYLSASLKEMSHGRTPKDPTESPEQAAKIIGAAMVQGGGLGIAGDFLFGQASRAGGGTIETLAGPAIGTGARVVDLYHRALRGDDVAASALQLAIANTPGLNLFYTRAALDYAVIYRLQESLNPGYLRRMEQRAQKEGQGFLLRPTAVQQVSGAIPVYR